MTSRRSPKFWNEAQARHRIPVTSGIVAVAWCSGQLSGSPLAHNDIRAQWGSHRHPPLPRPTAAVFRTGEVRPQLFQPWEGSELLLVLYLRFEGTKDNFSQITKIIASCFRMVGRHAGPKAFPFFMVKMTVIYWNAL